MPDALSLSRSELPEEIEKAIESLIGEAKYEGGRFSASDGKDIERVRSALTAAILSRLGEAEAGREEAEDRALGWERTLRYCEKQWNDTDSITHAKMCAALARVERLEKELADIKAAEAAEVERITAEQRANSIAYLQANIAQMERFMERGEEADPVGYMQWRSRRDQFQQELNAALTEAGRLAIKDA